MKAKIDGKVSDCARNLLSQLDEMRSARDFWKWGFWFLACACVVLAIIAT